MPTNSLGYLYSYHISRDMAEVEGHSWLGWQQSGKHSYDVQQ